MTLPPVVITLEQDPQTGELVFKLPRIFCESLGLMPNSDIILDLSQAPNIIVRKYDQKDTAENQELQENTPSTDQ